MPHRNTMIGVGVFGCGPSLMSDGAAALFNGCIFWAKFGWRGDLIPWPNRAGWTKLDCLTRSKKSTIPQSTVGGLFMFSKSAVGRNGGRVYGDGNLWGIFDAWGGWKAWPIVEGVVHINGSARSHSIKTPQLTSVWLGWGWIAQGMEKRLCFVVCIFLELWPAVLYAQLQVLLGFIYLNLVLRLSKVTLYSSITFKF